MTNHRDCPVVTGDPETDQLDGDGTAEFLGLLLVGSTCFFSTTVLYFFITYIVGVFGL